VHPDRAAPARPTLRQQAGCIRVNSSLQLRQVARSAVVEVQYGAGKNRPLRRASEVHLDGVLREVRRASWRGTVCHALPAVGQRRSRARSMMPW